MDYAAKRAFDQTPEPEPAVTGDVDPAAAPAGNSFVLEEAVVPAEYLEASPSIAGEGSAMMDAARAQGLPGIVAKQVSSAYEPGAVTDRWRKIRV